MVIVALASLTIASAAVVLCRNRAVRAAAERRDLLHDCARLFDEEPAHGVDRAGFGCLAGRVCGLRVRLSLLAEALAFRRLPQLWLRIEVREAMGVGASLNVVRRATNAEFYAPAAGMPVPYEVPPGWPADTLIRGTDGSQVPLHRLAHHADALLADPRLKEILLTPRGVRVSSQISQGGRGAYLLLRGSRFDAGRIAPEQVRRAVDEAVGLAHALRQWDDHDADPHAREAQYT